MTQERATTRRAWHNHCSPDFHLSQILENDVRDNGPGQDESHIEEKILAYLKTHPDAQDTLEGVVEWWLREQTIRHRTITVKAALKQLIKQGLVIEKKTEGHHPLYCLNPEKAGVVRKVSKEDG